MRIGEVGPFQLAKETKKLYPNLPVLLLLNVASDYVIWENNPEGKKYIDDVFLWNGDTKLFLAMIKSVEDKMNVEFDTALGLVRIILIVEEFCSLLFFVFAFPLFRNNESNSKIN